MRIGGLQTFPLKSSRSVQLFALRLHIILLNPRPKVACMAQVVHEFLREGVEARAYQLRSLERILTFSTLMVMPTGFGKTAVEWMVMAEYLRRGATKIVLVAPTTGLVDQQCTMAKERLNVNPERIIAYTGDTAPELRKTLWEEATVVMATPQVIRNDAMNTIIDLATVDLLIMDEAHHATGNHAYAQVGTLYQRAHPQGRVLAATASPGGNLRHINEVRNNLNVHNLDLSKRGEPLMLAYDVDMMIHLHRLDLPESLSTLLAPLKSHFDEEVAHLQRLGFLAPKEHIGTNDIEKAQLSASRAIQLRDVRGYDAARRIADLRRIHILMNLLQTQGTSVAKAFLDRAEQEGRTGRKTNRLLALPVVHQLRLALNDLDELHPKSALVESLVREELKEKPDGKVLIFTEYRDSVHRLVELLQPHEGLLPDVFIGQSSRGDQKGMTQKEQLAQLDRFRAGEINILVATSVGEEGLDVPSADLVVLYEPVPSAVRAIQRRGRTARQRAGSVHMLVTNDTRDAYVQLASERQEANMHRLLKDLVKQKSFKESFDVDKGVLDAFKVIEDDEMHSAKAYLDREVARLKEEATFDPEPKQPLRTTPRTSNRTAARLTPDQLRPKHQSSLFSHENHPRATESAAVHFHETTLVLNAADQEIMSLNAVHGHSAVIHIDHRESQSSLPGYLHGLGFTTVITRLPCGDVRLSERVLIERKTARDLLDSIKNGRLLSQCRSLQISARRPLLLVETGGASGYGLHPNSVLGALAHVTMDLGVPVMMVKDAQEAAHFIAVAAKREHDALDRLHRFVEGDGIDEAEINQRLMMATHELEAIETNPHNTHPWLDSGLEHLKRCFEFAVEPFTTKHPDLQDIFDAFSPDLGGLMSANVTKMMERSGCHPEKAAAVLNLLHEQLMTR
jgi:ERCC4-related helicase/ERCC4-type nuclease